MRAPFASSRRLRSRSLRSHSLLPALALLALFSAAALGVFRVQADAGLPLVELSAGRMGPRQIEELTNRSVPRDYALAWQSLAQALEQNRPDLLDAYFTGLAKEQLTQRINQQRTNGIRLRYEDHGHKLEGLFYSPAGDAMQLRDRAEFEIETLDGDKVIDSEHSSFNYMVLMTPGADRWLIRDLESIP
jgi:hypothetical protein